MDITETYVRMCRKAEEIQKLRQMERAAAFESGDWFFADEGFGQLEVHSVIRSWWYHCSSPCYEIMGGYIRTIKEPYVWLPRQDQLQEMVGGFKAGFIDWFYWRNAIYPHMQSPFNKDWKFTSMEQLWLAFVMKEKYGKVWNKRDWVKKEER